MVEIYLLEQLTAFHRCGTLSAAAKELHLAQPSLSRSMQKLEEIFGVPLFDRRKNRITLNETGLIAAEHAAEILNNISEMERHIQSFAKSFCTITIGSCAPGPLMKIKRQSKELFPDQAVETKIDTEDALFRGLKTSEYQLIILSHPLDSEDMLCKKYVTEHLYISINDLHPFATPSSHTITFKEADGQSFVIYANIGIWENVVRTNMPNAKLYKQEELEAVEEIAFTSGLPIFSTNISQEELPSRKIERTNIPFSDKESSITFYAVCLKKNSTLLSKLYFNENTK